ncbi:hypothetical protein [uncultured Prevotella sp.]|nr:hypothetical protein [uncultured Prevotella sp.]
MKSLIISKPTEKNKKKKERKRKKSLEDKRIWAIFAADYLKQG